MKKGLSLLLVLVTIFSLLSAGALAAEEEPTEEIAEETIAELTEESTEAATEEATAETVEAKETTEEATEESTEDFPISLDGNGDLLDSGTCGENLTWTLTNDGILTISGEGAMDNYYSWDWYGRSIKSIVIETGVTGIGYYAFQNCTSLVSITIPSTATGIQSGAFKDCTALEQIEVANGNQSYKSEDGILFSADGKTLISYPIGKTDASYTIPEGVEIVADYAFYHENGYSAALKTIDICTGVEVIGDYAFYGLYLNAVSLPSGLLSIGEYAFGCNGSMERITIPASVTNIGAAAFVWCNELETINVEAENAVYASVDGVLFNKEKTELCIYPTGKGADYGTYTVPKGVEKIWDHAFSRLTNVMIPDSVTTIGYESFTGGMVNPSMDIFYEGTEEQWKNIAVENPPLYDWNNPLERAVIHYEVDYSSVVAAGRCGDDVLWQLDTTGELTVYGSGATNGGTFFWCCAGYEDLIRSVTVCEGVSELGAMAFANCENIERVTLSEGMTSIDFGLFENCYSLEAVVIPVSIVSIGDAFGDCTKLKEVYYTGTMEQWNSLEINAANESLFTATIICSDGTIEPSGNCGANLQWTLNTDGALTISGDGETYDYGTVYISGNGSFYYGSPSPWYGARGRITTVVIESGVTGIGKNAFAYCTALTDVYYDGTEAERNAISINSGNTPLTGATWHYSETGTSITSDEVEVLIGKAVSGDIVVTVTANGVTLVENEDYTLTSTEVDGMISVTLKGCGDYIGNATKTLDHTPGDMDGRDGVTILDVLALLKAVAGITDKPAHADVNGDGDVTILDVLALLKYVAGISGSVVY